MPLLRFYRQTRQKRLVMIAHLHIHRIFVKEIATLVLFYCLKKIICRLIPSEQPFKCHQDVRNVEVSNHKKDRKSLRQHARI